MHIAPDLPEFHRRFPRLSVEVVAANRYLDFIEAGILDPAKVVRSALQNAVSIAGTMITTECAIRKPEKPQMSH